MAAVVALLNLLQFQLFPSVSCSVLLLNARCSCSRPLLQDSTLHQLCCCLQKPSYLKWVELHVVNKHASSNCTQLHPVSGEDVPRQPLMPTQLATDVNRHCSLD